MDSSARVIEITLLGGFEVVCDGVAVPRDRWSRRQAAALVKLLALVPTRRLHREQVVDALWPDHSLDDAAPKLHKAAHFARRAVDDRRSIVLHGDAVCLFPDADVHVDLLRFEQLAEQALRSGVPDELAAAAEVYSGDLLPEDLYDEWVDARRAHVRSQHTEILRCLERWPELLALDPTDEHAHVGVMRRLVAAGDHHGALRQYERLDKALTHELGVGPGPEARALRDTARAAAGPVAADDDRLLGRSRDIATIDDTLAGVAAACGGALLISGIPGVGKSALVAAFVHRAEAMGWRTGTGQASAFEGAWPYAPVLEAIADLSRRQPTLLDGLDDNYRMEIDRALAGTDLDWSGEGGHQRLFVAVAELLRIAAADRCVALVIDDLHDADEASIRLVHYLARCASTERIAIVAAHRPPAPGSALAQARASLVGRAGTVVIEVEPLAPADAVALCRASNPEIDDGTVDQVVAIADGVPFAIVELAQRAGDPAMAAHTPALVVVDGLDTATRQVLQRVAVLGVTFDTDEFVAVSGLDDEDAFAHLDRALDARVVEHAGSHYRFRHALVREALVDDVAPHRRSRLHREVADRLAGLDASPARIGYHLAEAGDLQAAAPYLIRAAERHAAVGAFRDALVLTDRIHAHVEGADRARVLSLRADLLFALGDRAAPAAYRSALAVAAAADSRLLRARLARAATLVGDLDTARAALDGLELDGGAADPDVLLARGHVAYIAGDLETAWTTAELARQRVLGGDNTWQVLDLIALQGLLAHTRGEWFDRIRFDLRGTSESPELARAIFDGYLCPAEYLLYGPMPYGEVIELARSLRQTANRAGALRADAFGAALAGEAALLAGDLDLAESQLRDAVDLHREIASTAGEAHSLQRLAEVHLARGDRERATDLLHRALPLARWSNLSLHLLQRVYGTLILAASDPAAARAMVDRAVSTLGTEDRCVFCDIMLAVPAAIACAQVGDIDEARRHLRDAEQNVGVWDGTSWQAAVVEARAHLARACGDEHLANELHVDAAQLFERAGQPLDARRCRDATAA